MMILIPEKYRDMSYDELRNAVESLHTPDSRLILAKTPEMVTDSCTQCAVDRLAAKLRLFLSKTEAANVGKTQPQG